MVSVSFHLVHVKCPIHTYIYIYARKHCQSFFTAENTAVAHINP